jgi:hypothetical protein
MEIKIKTQSEKTIQIELPCYTNFSGQYCKFINEEQVLEVEEWGDYNFGIELKPKAHCNPFANEGWKFITEDEFNEVHKRVVNRLSKYSPTY